MAEVYDIFRLLRSSERGLKEEASEHRSFLIRSLQAHPSTKNKEGCFTLSGSLIKRELPHSPLPLQSHFHAPNKGASVNRLSSPSLRDVLNDCREGYFLIFPSSLQSPSAEVTAGGRPRSLPLQSSRPSVLKRRHLGGSLQKRRRICRVNFVYKGWISCTMAPAMT